MMLLLTPLIAAMLRAATDYYDASVEHMTLSWHII